MLNYKGWVLRSPYPILWTNFDAFINAIDDFVAKIFSDVIQQILMDRNREAAVNLGKDCLDIVGDFLNFREEGSLKGMQKLDNQVFTFMISA